MLTALIECLTATILSNDRIALLLKRAFLPYPQNSIVSPVCHIKWSVEKSCT